MIRLFRHALRQLRESPGFGLTACLTLTLGIGASTAIFAVLDTVLLEPLPFTQPDRLVAVQPQPYDDISIPEMQDYQARSTTFASLAAYTGWQPAQKATDGTAAHKIDAVSQGFFSTLGARFALGTSWPITGNEQDCASLAVVSGGYWKRIGGGTTLADRKLNLDGKDFQIAGVLPIEQKIEGSGGLGNPEAFVPVGCDTEEHPDKRGAYDYYAIGRLKEGVSIAQAKADLAHVDQTLTRDYPNYYRLYKAGGDNRTKVIPYVELMVGTDTKSGLYLTLGACGLLLLIACANLANLLLARNTRRRAEFATRATLGATLGQLLQQLLVESTVLVALGAAGGIALATLVLRGLKLSTALRVPRLTQASISLPALTFVIALSAVVTLLLALLPAWRTLRPGLLRDLQGAGRSSADRSLRFAGRLLVVAQITLTLVLVTCAGWMIGSVYLLLHQPLGFTPGPLLMVHASLSSSHAKEDLIRGELTLAQLADKLRQLPGVSSVAVTGQVPLGHYTNEYDFCSDAHPEQCNRPMNEHPDTSDINPGYFATIGQPLLAGRDFNAADDGRNHVVIVNEALAAREWPGQSALGHRVHTGEMRTPEGDDAPQTSSMVIGSATTVSPKMTWATVVGVVGNVHDKELAAEPRPDIYVPRAEVPRSAGMLIMKVSSDPAALKNAVRETLKAQFPSGRFYGIETMQEEMMDEVAERAFLMQVAIAFGAIALFLSILGTYGLLAYEVSLREKEIGIRLALGSSRERIVGLLMHEEGRWLGAGAALGLACAAATGYALRARFYQAHTTSLPVLAGSTLLLIGSALVAIVLPASRAALQDPAETLRRE